MTKSVLITIPGSSHKAISSIAPSIDLMDLKDPNPQMLYGFHGSPSTKGVAINAAYTRASVRGEKFYMIDLTYVLPEGFDKGVLEGLLQPDMLDTVPLLITKRIHRLCAEKLGQHWLSWAKSRHGADVVEERNVDWTDIKSFIPAFPMVVDQLFATFPDLRCAVIPMHTNDQLMPGALTWVGVSPKSMVTQYVARAEVRMQPDIVVDLNF